MSNKEKVDFQSIVTFLEKAQKYILDFGMIDGLALARSEMSGRSFKFERRKILRLEKRLTK